MLNRTTALAGDGCIIPVAGFLLVHDLYAGVREGLQIRTAPYIVSSFELGPLSSRTHMLTLTFLADDKAVQHFILRLVRHAHS